MELAFRGTTIRLVRGDITEQEVDVIVNAANPSLLGGGGVDGAIHAAAGPSLLEACKAERAELGRELEHGEAVITDAGDLPAKRVVHAVGPVWKGGHRGENTLLERAYERALLLAIGEGHTTIAFPSISTGVYGFPVDRAAFIVGNTLTRMIFDKPGALGEIRLVLFSEEDYATYEDSIAEVIRTMTGTG